jgi:hypothetical protein
MFWLTPEEDPPIRAAAPAIEPDSSSATKTRRPRRVSSVWAGGVSAFGMAGILAFQFPAT